MERFDTRKYTIGIVIFVVVLGAIFVFRQKSVLFADSGQAKSSKKISLEINNKKKNFTLTQYAKSSSDPDPKYILSEKMTLSHKEILLEDLGLDAGLCPQSSFSLKGDIPLICLKATNGAHSENIVLIKYDKNELSTVAAYAENGEKVIIYSDVPDFEFKDYNNDGYVDIISSLRNYDADPLTDTIKYFFKNTAGGFVLDKTEAQK